MEAVGDLLLRISEAEGPLVYQSGLDKSVRNDDVVFTLERQKRRLELQLVDTACREAINVVQRNRPSWSARCLLVQPRQCDIDGAMRLVKLAEMTMLTPSVTTYYRALQQRLPLHPTTDPSVVALRLRVVWRNICVSGASAAVHFARPNKARLALGYSQRAVDLVRWVVLGVDDSAHTTRKDSAHTMKESQGTHDATSWMSASSMTALLSACFYEDAMKSEGRRSAPTMRATSAPLIMCSSSADRIVGLLSSHSTILKACEKYSEAAMMSITAVQAADALRDEVALRASYPLPFYDAVGSPTAGVGGESAHLSATLLVALTLFNASSCMEAVGEEAASRSIACPTALKKLCDRSQQYRMLRRCRELLSCCGDEGLELLERVHVKLSDHYHLSDKRRNASPLARSAHRRVQELLHWEGADANNTLHYFQVVAGRLSQEAQRYGRRHVMMSTDEERWRPANAASLLES
ncbi:Hypothetical protein, putative [Bodo saltans]|uniref:Uncharacterized protein n=1 Tax=Bodo saltans TaxID=75058 RepID=A0A0S4JFT7_BODSA|nr:Hypothetical protein, putative [Bodo saltans]|eukprot:CUG88263.1 Hypothetical protein, putative [Bodo saltans]